MSASTSLRQRNRLRRCAVARSLPSLVRRRPNTRVISAQTSSNGVGFVDEVEQRVVDESLRQDPGREAPVDQDVSRYVDLQAFLKGHSPLGWDRQMDKRTGRVEKAL